VTTAAVAGPGLAWDVHRDWRVHDRPWRRDITRTFAQHRQLPRSRAAKGGRRETSAGAVGIRDRARRAIFRAGKAGSPQPLLLAAQRTNASQATRGPGRGARVAVEQGLLEYGRSTRGRWKSAVQRSQTSGFGTGTEGPCQKCLAVSPARGAPDRLSSLGRNFVPGTGWPNSGMPWNFIGTTRAGRDSRREHWGS